VTATKSGAVEHVEDHPPPPENVASIVTFKAFYQDIPVLSIWWLSPFPRQPTQDDLLVGGREFPGSPGGRTSPEALLSLLAKRGHPAPRG